MIIMSKILNFVIYNIYLLTVLYWLKIKCLLLPMVSMTMIFIYHKRKKSYLLLEFFLVSKIDFSAPVQKHTHFLKEKLFLHILKIPK